MSNPDDFNDMMRRMGVKPMGKDGVRPTTRRRAKGAEKSTPSPAPGSQPTGSDEQADALQAQVATLEAQIEENQAASSVAQEQGTAERTKLEAEIERLEEEVAAKGLNELGATATTATQDHHDLRLGKQWQSLCQSRTVKLQRPDHGALLPQSGENVGQGEASLEERHGAPARQCTIPHWSFFSEVYEWK